MELRGQVMLGEGRHSHSQWEPATAKVSRPVPQNSHLPGVSFVSSQTWPCFGVIVTGDGGAFEKPQTGWPGPEVLIFRWNACGRRFPEPFSGSDL